MENLFEIRPLLDQFMTLIERQFGCRCEIVLSEKTDGVNDVIMDIRNGHVTNRRTGGGGNSVGIEVAPGVEECGNRFNYITTIRDGKILRSSTILLKNDQGKEIASLTVNTDITETLQLEGLLRQHNQFGQNIAIEHKMDTEDVSSLLERLIQQGQQKIGKPAEEMNKVEKVEFIRYLDERGAFLITKSGEKICELLEISKFTFYSYLEKSRSTDEEEEE